MFVCSDAKLRVRLTGWIVGLPDSWGHRAFNPGGLGGGLLLVG
jgi:hypothetical protein